MLRPSFLISHRPLFIPTGSRLLYHYEVGRLS
jgi:hypothetical protein